MITSPIKHSFNFLNNGKAIILNKSKLRRIALKIFKRITKMENFFLKKVFFVCLNIIHNSNRARVAYGQMLLNERKYAAALEQFKLAGSKGTNHIIKFHLENKNDVQLHEQVTLWRSKAPPKRVKNLLNISKVCAHLGLPEDDCAKNRKEVYEYAVNKELAKPRQVLTYFTQNGFLKEARELDSEINPPERRNPFLQEVLNRLGDIEQVIQTAGENSNLPILDKKVFVNGNLEKFSEVEGKVVEVCFPHTFLIKWSKTPDLTPIRRHLLNFYKNIFKYLEDNKVPFLPRIQYGFYVNSIDPGKCISLTYHSKEGHSNQYHIKYSAYSNYISLDRDGFAGWATISKKEHFFDLSQVNEETAKERWEELRDNLINKNISKFAQKNNLGESINHGKYIFIPLQVSDDCVSQLAYIDGPKMVQNLIEEFKNSDFRVIIKRHPLCTDPRITKLLNKAQTYTNVSISTESIHNLIANSEVVFTVNSGVGAEALLHLKPVVLTGKAEYAQAVIIAKTADQLSEIVKKRSWTNLKPEFIQKYLYAYTNDYLIASDDYNGLSKRLKEICL